MKAWDALVTPPFWRCQKHEASSKADWRQEVELAHGSNGCYRHQSWRLTAVQVNTERIATGFGVCPAGIQSCFAPMWPPYVPSLAFRCLVYAVLCWLYVLFFKLFYRTSPWDYLVGVLLCLWSQCICCLMNSVTSASTAIVANDILLCKHECSLFSIQI